MMINSGESSGSSIDGKVQGTMDQRADFDCFCSQPAYVREVKKKLMKREL
jgi:hypothetical protein